MIKIKEDEEEHSKKPSSKSRIQVILEDDEEMTFDGYPIAIRPKGIEPLIYEIQSPKVKPTFIQS